MWRIMAILGGVSGAVALSQFPEFSQQYLQRLAGKAEALAQVTAEFDATAAKNGLTREAALLALVGSQVALDHQADLRNDFARSATLSENLTTLRAASPLARLTMPQRFGDTEMLQATWADFRPAIPATSDGAVTAAIGYALGWGGMAGLFGLLTRPFRRRRLG